MTRGMPLFWPLSRKASRLLNTVVMWLQNVCQPALERYRSPPGACVHSDCVAIRRMSGVFVDAWPTAAIRSLPPPDNSSPAQRRDWEPLRNAMNCGSRVVSAIKLNGAPGSAQFTAQAAMAEVLIPSNRLVVAVGGMAPMENQESPWARNCRSY